MADQNAKEITGLTLLRAFLELRRYSSNLGDWSEERLAENPPRLYRLRRLIALFRAFEIDWSPSSFISGKFIDPESPRFDKLKERMAASMPAATWHALNHQLPHCFEALLEYRERVEHVLTFSSGVLEASGWYLYAYQKPEELNRIIRENISIIDDILVAFVSPEAKTFSVEQLARDYGYPDVDLLEIDMDWF